MVLTGYIVFPSLILRVSHFILLPIVLLIGSPIFLIHLCRLRVAAKK